MNELIRELAKRAHEDVRSDEEANGVCFKDYNLQFEKAFARLIVRESVKALWTEDCHVSDLAIIDFNEKKRKIFNHMGITE